ncbi:MAG: class I SAM-dependent methyltransferase [Actinomycetota bacterium]
MDLRERRIDPQRHPWEVARSRFFRRVVADALPSRPTTVIDVGAGDGWFAGQLLCDLPPGARITCWDAHYTDADLDEAVPAGLLRTATAPPYRAPLVLALDVIEHVADDDAFVRDEIAPLLAPGGTLVVSVPAHQLLFTGHDTALGHHRRYSARSLHDLLSRHLDVVSEGSLFTSLLLPRGVSAIAERVRPRSAPDSPESQWTHGRAVTTAVTTVLGFDAALGRLTANRRFRPPGLSVWAVCRARGTA